jgi:exodeoxyribonuclease VII large subunit
MLATDDPVADISLAFSPNALLNAIGNSLSSPLLNQVFRVKGIYKPGKGVNYNGAYYDVLKDEHSDSAITLVTPERLRPRLGNGQLIEASVFLSKRFQAASGRIDLLLTINELFSKKEAAISEQETRSFALLQKKAKVGYKDADSFIRGRLFNKEPVQVTLLVGQSAIIDQDIKHQVKEAAVAYQFNYVRVNLSQPAEIIAALQTHDGADILVIARGGGENLAIFDNPAIGEAALALRSIFITALGHSADEPLLQKLADKAFITPTALGQYFHDLYIKTIEDLNGSKAKLIGDLTKQIELNFQNSLLELQNRVNDMTRSGQEALLQSKNRLESMSGRLARTRTVNAILATVIGVLAILMAYFLLKK